MTTLPAAALALLLGAAAAGPEPGLVGSGILLPLQDRTSDPALARLVQETLAEALLPPASSTRQEPFRIRDAMRRLRLRSVALASPEEVSRLASELGADWLFMATLHSAVASPTPQITLSALALPADGKELAWAGFRSTTGLDGLRSLGRGVIAELEPLARQEARALVHDFLTRRLRPGEQPPEERPRPSRHGYAARLWSPSDLGLVAVLPFDSVTDEQATLHGETVTCLSRALLHQQGVRLASPGAVVETLRSRKALSLESLDPLTRLALKIGTGADMIFTGVVETYQPSPTLDPDPHVSLSARLLEPESGEILWIDGMEDRGSWGEAPFLRNRVRAAGRLAQDMLSRMLAGFLIPPTERPTAEEPTP